MSEPDFPALDSRWIHRKSGRICKVDGVRSVQYPKQPHPLHLVEFKYQRLADGMRNHRIRPQPVQTMLLDQWRELFTKPYEAP